MSNNEDLWEIPFDYELIICTKCATEYLVHWKQANSDTHICPNCTKKEDNNENNKEN